ncbi:MAG: TatD family hydrolase [Nocardioidaceae bacterium]
MPEAATEAEGRPPVPEPLPHPVVDNHCHLDMAVPVGRRDRGADLALAEDLRLAVSVGVPRVVQIGCDLPGARWAVQAARAYDAVVAGVALHPNEAARLAESGDLDDALAEIDRLAGASDRVRAVGETGLDYYRTEPRGRPAQHASFRAHIALAKKHRKTLVVHDRDAHADVLRILDEEGHPERVVMHCFSGDAEFADECARRGFWLSYAGTVTFKNAQPLRDALAVTPPDRVLVETDAPFLTPMPYRGRPNASYLVPLTVRSMAETLQADLGDLCRTIDANTERAFGGTW